MEIDGGGRDGDAELAAGDERAVEGAAVRFTAAMVAAGCGRGGASGDPDRGGGAGVHRRAGPQGTGLAGGRARSANATGADENPVKAIELCRKPVIGAINGVAITGGFEVALACDILIASEAARFADTHARVGVMPGWGLSAEAVAADRRLASEGAVAVGQFPRRRDGGALGAGQPRGARASLLPTARRLAEDIATADPAFIANYKMLIDDGFALPFGEAMALEHERSSAANAAVTPESVEARRAAVQARGRAQ